MRCWYAEPAQVLGFRLPPSLDVNSSQRNFDSTITFLLVGGSSFIGASVSILIDRGFIVHPGDDIHIVIFKETLDAG